MAREYARDVAFDALPAMLEKLLGAWLAHRVGPTETFFDFCRRHEIEALRALGPGALPRALAA